MVEKGFSPAEIASLIKRPLNQVKGIIKKNNRSWQCGNAPTINSNAIKSSVLSLCSNYYGPKITTTILDWLRKMFVQARSPLQTKQLQQQIKSTFGVSVSITTIHRILHREFSMSYKRVYRSEIKANTIQAKQKR